LDDFAELCRAHRQYTQADTLYQRALAIREKAFGANHPDVAASLENLAALCREMGRDKEAEPLEARAAAIRTVER
jgi:tetratricopeptide (TPR) repeat protein